MKHKDRMRLVGETGISLSTVIKWEKGGKVTEANDKALLRASVDLGILKANEDHETDKGV